MQLDKCDGSLEMLVAKLIVDRTGNARCANIMDDEKNACTPDNNNKTDNPNNDLRGASAAVRRLR